MDTSDVSDHNTSKSFNESLQVEDPYQHEKENCFYLFKKFIKEVYVRKKQFKDELLTACLEFILALPIELVVHNFPEVFESLKVRSWFWKMLK